MSRRKQIWIAVAVVVATLAGGAAVWAFAIREREGIRDERIKNPSVSDIASYKDRLVHSTDEFDAGDYHLTAWYIVQKDDGNYVRRWVATVEKWNKLSQNGKRVLQLPKEFMDQYLPVEGTA